MSTDLPPGGGLELIVRSESMREGGQVLKIYSPSSCHNSPLRCNRHDGWEPLFHFSRINGVCCLQLHKACLKVALFNLTPDHRFIQTWPDRNVSIFRCDTKSIVSFFKDCKNPSDGAAFLFSLCTVCVQYTVIILPDREVILDALLSCDSCLLPMLIFPRSTEVPGGPSGGYTRHLPVSLSCQE